jgi:two-component system LytT family response regulator
LKDCVGALCVKVYAPKSIGRSVVARLAELSVDLLLLDIRLPGESGFDLLERLDNVPALIFTTAYDEFAVRAFEVKALELVTGLAAAPAAIS